ncbi:MAG TPA: hypothetical protein VF681_11085 [Abditibacteriaceae bacterium]|jgi:hypothetical protein
MPELISPAQSEVLMVAAALVLALVGAFAGWRVLGKRGLVFGLVGPLIYGAWRVHSYVTRYDPQSGYFGLDKVSVLLLEVVAALVIGVALGRAWNVLANKPK